MKRKKKFKKLRMIERNVMKIDRKIFKREEVKNRNKL